MKRHTHNGEDGFSVPGGYYGSSAARIRERLACMDELGGMDRLLRLKGNPPFAVPTDYFEQKPLVADCPSLVLLKSEGCFKIPSGYFEENETQLGTLMRIATMGKAGTEEGAHGPFGVPADYFSLSASDLTRGGGKGRTGARVLRMFSHPLRFAAAAAIVLLLGAWLYRLQRDRLDTGDCDTIACLERKELLRSRVIESLSEDDLMQLIDGESLEEELLDAGQAIPLHDTGKAESGKGREGT